MIGRKEFLQSFVLSFLKTSTIMASFQHFDISSFSFPDLQNCLYRLEASLTATTFPDFGMYTTPSKGFTFLCGIDGIQQFLQFRIFINKCSVVMYGLCAMVSKAVSC